MTMIPRHQENPVTQHAERNSSVASCLRSLCSSFALFAVTRSSFKLSCHDNLADRIKERLRHCELTFTAEGQATEVSGPGSSVYGDQRNPLSRQDRKDPRRKT
jgi:hypothetical protein